MTRIQDLIQDLKELSKQDGIDRACDISFLEQLESTDELTAVEPIEPIDFWNLCSDKTCNSYNWNGITTFLIKQVNERLTGISIHRAGDARCNYTDEVYYACSMEELLNTIAGFTYSFEVNGWTVYQDYLDESCNISAINHATNEEYTGTDFSEDCPAALKDCTY